MEILTEITKAVFERNVPSAQMPANNTSVYDRLQGEFERSYDRVIADIISANFVSVVDSNEILKSAVVRFVCLDAFLNAARSLDLVLTATGFGVVSTQGTAPASRARVDALIQEIAFARLCTQDVIILGLIRVNGWGATEQAKRQIPCLFFRPTMLRDTTLPSNAESWEKARAIALTADSYLREEIGDEYMDELLTKLRSNSLENQDIIIYDKCNRFTANFISGYERGGLVDKRILMQIVDQLESYADTYSTYKSSKVYAKRHSEGFTNKKTDPTFFFM